MTQPPPYVLGIDSGLEYTGLGAIELTPDGCRARTTLVKTPSRGDTLAQRFDRIEEITSGAALFIGHHATLAGIEGPAYEASYGKRWDRAVVWGYLVGTLLHRDIPTTEIPPPTLKKWATGHGRAEKTAVIAALRAMWPGVPALAGNTRDHEAEGLAIAHICAQHLGWPVPMRKHHGDALAVIRWPDTTPTTQGATHA